MAFVETRDRGGVRVIALNRPEARNAMHAAMRAELRAALAPVNGDPAIRAVVIAGAGGKAFCAGNDLAETRALTAATSGAWVESLRRSHSAIRNLDKPCVAAIEGAAAGAGLQIALLCDLRIGGPGARIGQPEINVGLASVIGVQLMELALGHTRTQDLALSGRLVDSAEALAIGLLDRVVPADALLDEAETAARFLADRPPGAFRLSKRRLRDMTQAAFDSAFRAAAELQREAYESGEPQAIMARFFTARERKSGSARQGPEVRRAPRAAG